MADEGFKRKLTAILSADAVGYSRLMAEDEAATVKTIATYREVMTSLIKQHRGRVVDSPGDNVLAEFSSVVDAVQCAVAVQNEFQTRNAELAENRRMEFRIGINLGDVIDEEDRIYGDGVNIAARLEALADPAGICVSKTAFDQIETKLPLGYEYLGEQSVKNIPKPVAAYRVLMKPEAVGKVIGEKRFLGRFSRRTALAAIVILVVVAGSLVGWNIYLQQSKKVEPASVKKMAFPLPEKTSIAVLPFKNISGDSDQEFLADGITESIISAVSRVSGLFVIASNSVFTYKGKAVKIQTVSEELGVQNVLEGTVQRDGNRLRINAQLIDAIKGRHLWSERYDREMQDLFAVQDNISKEVLTALRVKLVEGEQARVWARGTNNLDAYLKFLQAYDHFKSFNKNSMILTRQVCEEAIALDPKYELPNSLIGTTHLIDLWFYWGESPRSSIENAEVALQKAVALNPLSDYAYANLGHLYLLQKRHDESVKAGEKAIALNPNGDYNMILLGITFNYVQRYEEAIRLFREGQRRNPYCPAWYIHNMAYSYLGLGRYDEAIVEAKRALDREPNHFPAIVALASVYGNAGRLDEGRTLATEILKIDPRFSLASVEQWPYKHKADAELVMDGLRKVGIPDK
jgi:adenylate cyclase